MKAHPNSKIIFVLMYKNCFTFHFENSFKKMHGTNYCLLDPQNFDTISLKIIHKETLRTIKTFPKNRKILILQEKQYML